MRVDQRGRLIRTALLVALAAPAAEGGGQLPGDERGPRRAATEPTWWGSAWAGYQWSNLVGDPGTQSVWNFDSNWSMRLTAERSVAPRTTAGVAWSYSRMPVIVNGNSSATACRPSCTGEATIASYGVLVRSGGGPGLQLVTEGFLGVLQYGNFALEGGGASQFAGVRNRDFAWALSTGVAYALSRDFQLSAMFDFGNSVHEKANDLFQQRTTRHYTTRVGLRVGL